jgi:uncharacterized Zn finger protein
MADYANRIPRGRTYARNGSIVDLNIEPGRVVATVAGGDYYKIEMDVKPLPISKWEDIKLKCQGQIATMVDLLMGRFSHEVMKVVCDPTHGMFPLESEISFKCSCPDWAKLCKHISAVFYGIGNRLDKSPELLFLLRRVNPLELFEATAKRFTEETQTKKEHALEGDLSSIFGVVIETDKPENKPTSSKTAKAVKTAKSQKASPPTKSPKGKKLEDANAEKKENKSEDGRIQDEELQKVINSISADKQSMTLSVKGSGLKPDFDEITAEDFIKLRKYCCMTTDEIANGIGISQACVRRWETLKGKLNAQPKTVAKMKNWWANLS